MKLNKLLVCLALVGLGATSCTPRNRSNGGICGGGSNAGGSNAGESGAGVKFDTTDPYKGVLEGLDTSKSNKDYSGNILKGYVASDNVCYGWTDYVVESWGGAKYGVAVKLTFNEVGLVDDIEIGAPAEGYTNFSSNYGDGSIASVGQEIYLTKYLKSERANVLAVIKGKSAPELLSAFGGLKCDDSGAEGMDKWKVRSDDTYDFMGTGATQTDTRLQTAIFNACNAYVSSTNGYSKYDPFYNDGEYLLPDEMADEIKPLIIASSDTEQTITGHSVKLSDNLYVGFAAYQAWGAYYGAGISVVVDPDKKIQDVSLGYPVNVGKEGAWHNFTPSYIVTNPTAYWNYVLNFEKNVENLLLDQTVNQDLINKVNKASMVIPPSGKEGGNQSIDAQDFAEAAGATQSSARMNMAISAVLSEILNNNN